MERLTSFRASDADREEVAAVLRHATAEGRLSGQELEERLDALFAAPTYGELDALTADLPASRSPRRQRVVAARWVGAVSAVALLLAVLGMISLARRHYASMIVRPGESGPQFRFSGPPDGLIVAASTVGLFAVALICAAAVWAWMRSRTASEARTAPTPPINMEDAR